MVKSTGRAVLRARIGGACAAGLALSACMLSGAAEAAADCTLSEVASLPADFSHGDIRVDVSVNGEVVKFLLATASSFTEVGDGLVQRLTLAQPSRRVRVNNSAGTIERDTVIVPSFKIGQMAPVTATLVMNERWSDGTNGGVAGILGLDFLRFYDVEIDPSLKVVNLFAPINCVGHAAYWSDEHFELPLVVERRLAATAQVTIDGRSFWAKIDTEAVKSSIDITEARRQLDVPDSAEPPAGAPAPTYTFKELVFGPITLRNPKLELKRYKIVAVASGTHIKDTYATDKPVVIGMDVLGKLHSMISYANDKMFFTLANERSAPNSAPVKP